MYFLAWPKLLTTKAVSLGREWVAREIETQKDKKKAKCLLVLVSEVNTDISGCLKRLSYTQKKKRSLIRKSKLKVEMVSGTQAASLLQPGSTQSCTALPSHFTSEKPLLLLLCLLHLISLEYLDAILNTPFPSFLHFSQPSHHSANAVHANSPKQNPPWEKWLFIALPWSSSSQYVPLLPCWGSTSRTPCSVWGSSRTTERKKKKDLCVPLSQKLCSPASYLFQVSQSLNLYPCQTAPRGLHPKQGTCILSALLRHISCSGPDRTN